MHCTKAMSEHCCKKSQTWKLLHTSRCLHECFTAYMPAAAQNACRWLIFQCTAKIFAWTNFGLRKVSSLHLSMATQQIADVNNHLQPEGEHQREQEVQGSVDRGRGQDIKWGYKQADTMKQQWQQVWDNMSLHGQSCSLHIHTCLSPGYQFMVAVHLQSSPNLSHTLTQTQNATPETKCHLPPCHTPKHRDSGV